MGPTGREPVHRAEADLAGLPPPPLDDAPLAQWGLTPGRLLLTRVAALLAPLLLLGVIYISVRGPAGPALPFGLRAGAASAPPFLLGVVAALLAISTVADLRRVRHLVVYRDHVLIATVFGWERELALEGIRLAKLGPLGGLRVCLSPALPWNVLTVARWRAGVDRLYAALGQIGVPTQETWW